MNMKNINLNERIIFALDFNSTKLAKLWIGKLKNKIKFYKIGMQLFSLCDIDFLKWIKDQDLKILLDLKLFDIPRTVNTVLQSIYDEVDYITVHSRKSVISEISNIYRNKILGVTVLTCFNNIDINYEYNSNISDLVIKRVSYIVNNNCAGVISSGNEIKSIRNIFRNDNLIIAVPAVRINKDINDDQKRISTIEKVFKDKADYAIIGRPIYNSHDYVKTIDYLYDVVYNILN